MEITPETQEKLFKIAILAIVILLTLILGELDEIRKSIKKG